MSGDIQGGSNMTGTDLYVNKPHCAAAVQCGLFTYKSVPVIFEPPCISRYSLNLLHGDSISLRTVSKYLQDYRL